MNACRRHIRFATWLALVATLALALLPTLSHALAHAQARTSTGFTEVCTPFGMKVVALADDDRGGHHGGPAPGAALHLEHCAYCAGGFGAALAPPPAPLQALPAAPAAQAALPRLFLLAPRTLHAWASARPRGPPTRV